MTCTQEEAVVQAEPNNYTDVTPSSMGNEPHPSDVIITGGMLDS